MNSFYYVKIFTPENIIIKEKYLTSRIKANRFIEEFAESQDFIALITQCSRAKIKDNEILIIDYEILEYNSNILHFKAEIHRLILK